MSKGGAPDSSNLLAWGPRYVSFIGTAFCKNLLRELSSGGHRLRQYGSGRNLFSRLKRTLIGRFKGFTSLRADLPLKKKPRGTSSSLRGLAAPGGGLTRVLAI